MADRVGARGNLLMGVCVAALYAILGAMDLACSLAAFNSGVPEANPVMAWMGSSGLFVHGKLLLTAAAAIPIGIVYCRNRAKLLCWCAIATAALVDICHVVGLIALAASGHYPMASG